MLYLSTNFETRYLLCSYSNQSIDKNFQFSPKFMLKVASSVFRNRWWQHTDLCCWHWWLYKFLTETRNVLELPSWFVGVTSWISKKCFINLILRLTWSELRCVVMVCFRINKKFTNFDHYEMEDIEIVEKKTGESL